MALNPLVSVIGRLVARSGRKRGTDRRTEGRTDGIRNDKTTTVTLAAHARRGLMKRLPRDTNVVHCHVVYYAVFYCSFSIIACMEPLSVVIVNCCNMHGF